MWSNLPFDLLSSIFSFLPPHSLARARSVCHHWHTCAMLHLKSISISHHHLTWWFLALPIRNRGNGLCCYIHNPVIDTWHVLSLDFLPDPVRPITSVGGLLLVKSTNCTILKLILCNPFTRQFKYLPMLNITRTNPAVGVVVMDSAQAQDGPFPCFRIYVAGGMSDVPRGGATYEPTLEMYNSRYDTWEIVGPMRVEFAVRLTVWTPNESVYIGGVLYWMTSARAYSVMGFEMGSNTWRELSVPLADKLEFATLTRRKGRLILIGGTSDGGACVWELDKKTDFWCLIENVPSELGLRLLRGKASWGSTKCVGSDGAICLYKEVGLGMIAWREVEDKSSEWVWTWVDGCCFIRGRKVQNVPIKGVFIHPSLAPSCILDK